jgi:hypothetical protein
VNSWQLTFSERHDYSEYSDILLPLVISSDVSNQVLVRAKLDTGSDLCIFQRRYAELLNLELERGTPKRIRTVTGSFTAYGHELTLIVGRLEWHAIIYFAEPESFPINVVGRIGFLDRLRVGLVDYEQRLYLNAYDEALV